MPAKKAFLWVLTWIALAASFDAGIYFISGKQKALEFMGGYIIEQSLSVDNLFLFLVIFSSFGIPPVYQRRVLNYGIIGAIILRLIFIVLGVAAVNRFHWILYIFGILLIISGVKMFLDKGEPKDFKNSKVLKFLGKIMPVTEDLNGEKFFLRRSGVLYATPLFAILLLIEASDLVFAIDSIPAVFSVSTDPLIVYSSNIFAILGLRNMYFILEKIHHAFYYVKYGVAAVLFFTGIKLSLLYFQIDIPLTVSIGTIFAVLLFSVAASVVFPAKTGTNHSLSEMHAAKKKL